MTKGEIIFGCILQLLKIVPLDEIKPARASVRDIAINMGLGEALGFREPRRPRAKMRKTGLQLAPRSMRSRAKRLRAEGKYTAHELEAKAALLGYKLTRNMQSQDDGANA